jgi:hypothetical protein
MRIGALSLAIAPLLLGWFSANPSGMSGTELANLLSAYLNQSLYIFQIFVVLVGAPFLASMSFADERQGGTLDLLVLTGARWPSILGVKFISIFLQVILLLIAIMPFAAIGALFGGVDVIALTGRTVALATFAYAVCAAGILASVSSVRWEVSVVRTFGLMLCYGVLSYVPDWVSGNMAGTKATHLVTGATFGAGVGGAPWESQVMALATGSVFLIVAIRLSPLKISGTIRKTVRTQTNSVPDDPSLVVAKLVELMSIRDALPWTRSRRRSILFIGVLCLLSFTLPISSFFLLGFAAYSAAAAIRQLNRAHVIESLRLVTNDRQLARIVIRLQLRWGAIFMVVPLATTAYTTIVIGAGIGMWQFYIANALMMCGFVLVIVSVASLASTFRGGVALHTFAAFGVSYLLIMCVIVLNSSIMGSVLGGVWMAMQTILVAAIACYFFAHRFPNRMPAG